MLTGKFGVDADDGIVFFENGIQFGSGKLTPFGIKEGFREVSWKSRSRKVRPVQCGEDAFLRSGDVDLAVDEILRRA